jgi:hypothetical protein
MPIGPDSTKSLNQYVKLEVMTEKKKFLSAGKGDKNEI